MCIRDRSTTTCYVVGDAFTRNNGGLVFTTRNGGATWVSKILPSTVGALEAVACPSASACYVAGFGGGPHGLLAATSDGGATWTVRRELGENGMRGVACTSTTTCYAASSTFTSFWQGVVLATTDGGATWASQPVPADVTSVSGIACSATCFATGSGETTVGAVILSLSGALAVGGTGRDGPGSRPGRSRV